MMSRASSVAARKRRRQRSAIRLTAYQPEYEELARAWLTSDQEEVGGDGWDKWIHGDWQYRWVVMRGDVPVGLVQAAILPPEAVPKGSQTAAPVCEIGYLTGPDYRGQHIATDTVALLPRQPELRHVKTWLAAVRRDNVASVKVLERSGFRYTGASPKPGYMGYIRP
jgi:RimJ/RimL family protein N-acetyltransferase